MSNSTRKIQRTMARRAGLHWPQLMADARKRALKGVRHINIGAGQWIRKPPKETP